MRCSSRSGAAAPGAPARDGPRRIISRSSGLGAVPGAPHEERVDIVDDGDPRVVLEVGQDEFALAKAVVKGT